MVKDIMTTEVITISPEATVKEAAALMESRRLPALPVVDGEGRFLGLISENSLLRRVLPDYTDTIPGLGFLPDSYACSVEERDALSQSPVAAVMETDGIVTAGEGMTVAEAAHLMLKGGLRVLPVLRDGKLVGIASRRDLVRAVLHPALGGCGPRE